MLVHMCICVQVAARLEKQLAETRLKVAQTEQEKDEMEDEIADLREELERLKGSMEKDLMAKQFRFKGYNNNNNNRRTSTDYGSQSGNPYDRRDLSAQSPRPSSISGFSRSSSRRSSFAHENDMMEFLAGGGAKATNFVGHKENQQPRPVFGQQRSTNHQRSNSVVSTGSEGGFMNPVKNQAPPASFIGRLFG
jgi:TolA-binding protein